MVCSMHTTLAQVFDISTENKANQYKEFKDGKAYLDAKEFDKAEPLIQFVLTELKRSKN